MPKLIKDNQIVDDTWQLVHEASELTSGDIIVALPVWLANKKALLARKGEVGLLLNSDDEPENVKEDIDFFAVIAVNFPLFSDGRGYTIARLLRERYQFAGEVRAVGDVLQDQLFYMKRCGFNAFAIRADKDIESALKSLDDFSDSYQAGVDQPLPLFRRR